MVCPLNRRSVLPAVMPKWRRRGSARFPGGFFANIDDTTDVILGSLNDQGYIARTDPLSLGGLYASQPNAVGVVTNEAPNLLGAVDIHAEYVDPTPLPNGVVAILNFNIFEPETPTLISDTLSMARDSWDMPQGGSTRRTCQWIYTFFRVTRMRPCSLSSYPMPLTMSPKTSTSPRFINQVTGLTNAHVQFVLRVPEPLTFELLGLGIASPSSASLAQASNVVPRKPDRRNHRCYTSNRNHF